MRVFKRPALQRDVDRAARVPVRLADGPPLRSENPVISVFGMHTPALQLSPSVTQPLRCSMCDRDASTVRYLMAGVAGGHICDACTVVAMGIVVSQRVKDVFRSR